MAFSPAARLLGLLPAVEYEDEVNAAYDGLPTSVQQEFTKDDLQQILDSKHNKEKVLNELKKGAVYLAKLIAQTEALRKLQTLSKLTISPRETDLLLARSLFEEQYKTPRSLDPSGYSTNGLEQSYETLTSNALFSTRTINELDGDSVHFMMFRHGETMIECQRFSCGHNPLISGVVHQGDPCLVDEEFCQLLGIEAGNLANHPLRLEMIQHVLRTQMLVESEVQALFLHLLGGLVQELEGAESNMRVCNVVGMNAVIVSVEVCNEYLCLAGKPENSGGTGTSHQLSIKSDAVVCHKSFAGDSNQAFLHCAYHIEIKQAMELKHSAMDCKSQLLAESLAKSQALLRKDKQLPQVIYSVLCDGLCLHVLIHFPRQSKAYLSHREIEPGRMICVITWLHKLSARNDLTEEEFLDIGLCIGDSLDSQVQNVVTKKSARVRPQGTNKSKARPNSKTTYGTKRAYPSIDVVAEDERSQQAERQRGLATFSSFQNYYRYNDPLPLTEAVLESFHDGQPPSTQDKLQRGGFEVPGRRTSNFVD